MVKRASDGLGKDWRSIRIGGGEPLPIRTKCPDDLGSPVHNPILAVHTASEIGVQAYASVVIGGGNAARQTRLELRDAADLPSPEGFASETRLLPEERQLVEIVDDHNMAGVELGRAPQHARVVRIGNDVALARPIIHALGESVRDAELKSVAESPVPSDLQRSVHGVGHIVRLPNGTEALVRTYGVDVDARICCHGSEGRLIDVGFSLQMQTTARHVANTQH